RGADIAALRQAPHPPLRGTFSPKGGKANLIFYHFAAVFHTKKSTGAGYRPVDKNAQCYE
ncbi:MAG: hypothetical protein IKC02_04400, partial [Oscillospiraceae bacterium]|nr:hypothetical protein [Oscillospiraceae bacterium]